jgi:hypothetical protein
VEGAQGEADIELGNGSLGDEVAPNVDSRRINSLVQILARCHVGGDWVIRTHLADWS